VLVILGMLLAWRSTHPLGIPAATEAA
jgi:hypothetical protein